MAFKPTKKDLQRSQTCPAGMKLFTLINVETSYLKENGNEVQQCDFETDDGYIVPVWFNSKMLSTVLNFVQAADGIKFEIDDRLPEVELRDYLGKKVAGSVSHRKDDNGKIQAQIDEFFTADKVPF